jgi:sugar phosphate isomerase/epimerase
MLLKLLCVLVLFCSTRLLAQEDPPKDGSQDAPKEELIRPPTADAAPAPKPEINYAAFDKLGVRLGCQAYTFRALSLFETIDQLQALGIHYIEIYPGQRYSKEKPSTKVDHNLSQDLIGLLLEKLKSADIKAVSYGVVGLSAPSLRAGSPPETPEARKTRDVQEARKVFEFAKKMGLEQIVAEPPFDAFEMLDKLCQEFQINLAIHDHQKPSPYWNPDKVLEVTQGRSNRIGACADTGHWARSGLVPVECLKKLESRIIELHFKDLNEMGMKAKDVPWGTGVCDVKAMMAELKRQGARPLFLVEYETSTGTELVRNVAKCCEVFSGIATELTIDAK